MALLTRFLLCLAIGWACAGLVPIAWGDSLPISEDEIKAAFLFNFAKFVEWPREVPAITVCVIGREAFVATLDQTVRNKTANGRAMVVRRSSGLSESKGCQIVFFGASDRSRIRHVLDGVPTAGILTIGETEGFTQYGGIINFIKDSNKLRFEVNVDAATRAQIRISSKLLQLARIVRD